MGLLITGMHRSGTSMFGQWAETMGLSAGSGLGFETTSANPRGLYERRDVVEFNERWLGVLGGSWWAPPFVKEQTWRSIDEQHLDQDRRTLDLFAAGFRDWYVKDPRLSLLLPLWDRLTLQRLPVVVGVRPPREVAMSLNVRNGTTLRRGLALWVAYNRALLRHTGGRSFMVLDLPATLRNPADAAARMLTFLDDQGFTVDADPEAIASDMEPDLVRQDCERLEGSAERLAEDLDPIYRELVAMHGQVQSDTVHRLPLPDWAGEALDELGEFWDLAVRAEAITLKQTPRWRRWWGSR